MIAGFSIIFALFISGVSLFHTTSVQKIDEGRGVSSTIYNIKERLESVIYYNDNFIWNLILLAICLLVAFFAVAKLKKIKLRYQVIFLFLWTFILGTTWVISSQSAPTEDSYFVTNFALEFSNGDFSILEEDRYFKNCSYQLGYVFFNEILIRIARIFKPVTTFIFLEVCNAFFLSVIYVFLLLLLEALFHNPRINMVATILLALSAAPLIFCSFVYGVYPGMMFALIALYCEIRYLKDNKIVFGILAIPSIVIAVMVKSNYLIWLIAMVLICLVVMFRRKKYAFDIGFLVLAVGLSMAVQPSVKAMYENRSGVDLGDSIPYVSWIAMGLNESDLAPGWYDYHYNITNFEESDFNAEKAAESSKKEIADRMHYFVKNPQYANDFFYLKAVSQWNETTYESIWNNVVRNQYQEKGKLSDWVCNQGQPKVRRYMDVFAQFIFFAFLVSCVYTLRKKNFLWGTIPLIFVGGFLFLLLSEGKSQYVMPYFILMTGFSAFGIVSLYDKFAEKIEGKRILSAVFLKRTARKDVPSEKNQQNQMK